MLLWKKIGENAAADGTYTITYRADGCDKIVQSRRVAIPHANRKGSWLHTSYFVLDPATGKEKEYWRLRKAQAAAEGGGAV